MSVTINVNGLSLCHKGSGGYVKNTIPDVCLTPDKCIPKPYSIVSYSKDLVKGTTSIEADGGNMCANLGSEFSCCTGDGGGSCGGIISGTTEAESTWITYSPDVFMEGKPVCRLTDKMWMNHGNSAAMSGLIQPPLDAAIEIAIICSVVCFCDKNPIKSSSGKSDLKEECVKITLLSGNDALEISGDNDLQNLSTIKPEIPYNMTTSPPTPLLHRADDGNLKPTERLGKRMLQEGLKAAVRNNGIYEVRIPDVIVVNDLSKPLVAGNLKAVVEIKFNNQSRNQYQISDYEEIAGDPNRVVELDPKKCGCADQPKREPVRVPVFEPMPVPKPESSILDWEYWEEVTGLTGAALIIYLIVSEGSRLFPPRNLIPVP